MRCGTLTIRTAEMGWKDSWAMGAMLPTREYWFPCKPVSFWRPKIDPYPRTDLSRIWRKYTQMRITRITLSVFRQILLSCDKRLSAQYGYSLNDRAASKTIEMGDIHSTSSPWLFFGESHSRVGAQVARFDQAIDTLCKENSYIFFRNLNALHVG